jgi:antitoxin VapB
MIARSKIFKTNRSQAVRIPKALAFPESVDDVEIMKVGNSRLVIPVGKNWTEYFENGPFATDDFMAERDVWEFEDREPL